MWYYNNEKKQSNFVTKMFFIVNCVEDFLKQWCTISSDTGPSTVKFKQIQHKVVNVAMKPQLALKMIFVLFVYILIQSMLIKV